MVILFFVVLFVVAEGMQKQEVKDTIHLKNTQEELRIKEVKERYDMLVNYKQIYKELLLECKTAHTAEKYNNLIDKINVFDADFNVELVGHDNDYFLKETDELLPAVTTLINQINFIDEEMDKCLETKGNKIWN